MSLIREALFWLHLYFRAWVRSLVLRACPEVATIRTTQSHLLRLQAELGLARAEFAQLREHVENLQGNVEAWQTYAREVGTLATSHEKEISWLKIREASGATFKALDLRLGRIECLLLPPVSDGQVVGRVKGGAA